MSSSCEKVCLWLAGCELELKSGGDTLCRPLKVTVIWTVKANLKSSEGKKNFYLVSMNKQLHLLSMLALLRQRKEILK